MKKIFTIFSIFLFLSFCMNTTTTVAQVNPIKKFSEGFYNMNDLGLMENVIYNVQNVSDYNGFLVVFDSDQKIQQAISVEPHSSKHPLKNIRSDDRVVILGKGQLTFPY